MKRINSREILMKLVYEMMINKTNAKDTLENFKEHTEENLKAIDLNYIDDILKGVEEKSSILDSKIEKHLKNWKLYRISKVNLAILRIAVYEMLFVKDIPKVVSINEAVELAKKYSEHNASGFINGVLDSFHKELKQEETDGQNN